MSAINPTKLQYALATLRGTLIKFAMYSSFFLVLGSLALDRCIRIGPLESFRLGSVEIPKFSGAYATNLSVAILCGVAVLVIVAGLVYRYLYFRAFLARMRSQGQTDLNSDGEIDVYTDRFLDDF